MKKTIIILALFCFIGTGAFALDGKPNRDTGDISVNVGLNFWPLGIGAGVEYIFARADITSQANLTFGAAFKAAFGFLPWMQLPMAILATMHFGLGSFTALPRWAQGFDFYVGLGLGMGVGFSSAGSYGSGFGIGIAGGAGMAYHFDDHFAIYSEGYYTSFFGKNAWGSALTGVGLLYTF